MEFAKATTHPARYRDPAPGSHEATDHPSAICGAALDGTWGRGSRPQKTERMCPPKAPERYPQSQVKQRWGDARWRANEGYFEGAEWKPYSNIGEELQIWVTVRDLSICEAKTWGT